MGAVGKRLWRRRDGLTAMENVTRTESLDPCRE